MLAKITTTMLVELSGDAFDLLKENNELLVELTADESVDNVSIEKHEDQLARYDVKWSDEQCGVEHDEE